MRLKSLSILFIISSLSLFFWSEAALAQDFPWPIVKGWFATLLGVPVQWVEWPTVFWLLILPYLASLAIIFGLMEEIRIFRRAEHKTAIYFFIALCWALFLIPTGVLGFLATFIYPFGALFSVVVFSGVFFIGVVWWGWRGWKLWGTGGLEYTILEAKKARIESITRQIDNLERKVAIEVKKRHPDFARIRNLRREIEKLETLRSKLEKEI